MGAVDHFAESERLLAEVARNPGMAMPNTIAAAQVHALLALAAALSEGHSCTNGNGAVE